MTESHEDSLSLDHNWCTKQKSIYDIRTKRLNQKLFQITFKNDGYLLGLGINSSNMTGQWIDNIKENNKFTEISISHLKDDIFDSYKVLEIAKNQNSINLENMANKLSELPEDAKNSILIEF